ncbi:MAG TPA: ABC transporter permease [Acidimicrobiales bacterium]|nr:ABC transporter permease [Acidimicrobiales bacterium]
MRPGGHAPGRTAGTQRDQGPRRRAKRSFRMADGRRRGAAWRVGIYLVTLWAVVTVVFFLPRVMPGDPLTAIREANSPLNSEDRAILEAHYNLDQPLLTQYGLYLSGLARRDMGLTIGGGAPVGQLIWNRLPWTLLLMGTSLAVSSAIGFAAGVSAAWRRGGRVDRRLLTVMTVLHAVPEYVLATALLLLFVVRVPLFPSAGAATPFTQSYGQLYKLADVGYHLVLPATALTLGLLGTKFRLVRNTTISVLGQNYMVAARAKGVPERLLKRRHAGRNVLLPFLTVVGLQVAFAAGGSMFVETVFQYPGMASLMLPAIENLDFPLMEACFVMLAILVLTANLIVDLTYARLDPRVRTE